MSSRPTRFLLVEDDDAHAELILMTLAENQISNPVDRVSDGEAALAYVRGEGSYANRLPPDIILLDLKLPKIDGHEVLAQLKADEKLRAIPVVVLTTSATEVDKAKAYYSHANSYLIKPIDFEKFRQMVMDLRMYWSVWNEPPRQLLPAH